MKKILLTALFSLAFVSVSWAYSPRECDHSRHGYNNSHHPYIAYHKPYAGHVPWGIAKKTRRSYYPKKKYCRYCPKVHTKHHRVREVYSRGHHHGSDDYGYIKIGSRNGEGYIRVSTGVKF